MIGDAIFSERAAALQDNMRRYRFLASHVEEDRIFRLSTHDLHLLDLVPTYVIGPSPTPGRLS